MKKSISKIQFSLVLGIMLYICLTLFSSIKAFAETNEVRVLTTQTQKSDSESVLMQKQQEIDKYVFEQHAKEIEQMGFKVTHTGQIQDYVEIGITPFSKGNAEYLYNIFGKDIVKVVEGQQAVLMNGEVTTTTAELKNDTKADGANPLIYTIIAVAALGIIGFAIFKQKATK